MLIMFTEKEIQELRKALDIGLAGFYRQHKEFRKMKTPAKTPQEKAAELLPFVQALANGEEVLQGDFPANGNFIYGLDFSIKPKMMLVNGFEVPEPMRLLPAIGSFYFTPYIKNCVQPDEIECEGDKLDLMWISLGICHSTKEAAIAHAKAMLGIDPNGGE